MCEGRRAPPAPHKHSWEPPRPSAVCPTLPSRQTGPPQAGSPILRRRSLRSQEACEAKAGCSPLTQLAAGPGREGRWLRRWGRPSALPAPPWPQPDPVAPGSSAQIRFPLCRWTERQRRALSCPQPQAQTSAAHLTNIYLVLSPPRGLRERKPGFEGTAVNRPALWARRAALAGPGLPGDQGVGQVVGLEGGSQAMPCPREGVRCFRGRLGSQVALVPPESQGGEGGRRA